MKLKRHAYLKGVSSIACGRQKGWIALKGEEITCAKCLDALRKCRK